MIVNDFEVSGTKIIKYVGKGGNVILPEGYTQIEETAFMEYKNNKWDSSKKLLVTSLHFSSSLESLNDAFYGMRNCKKVTFATPSKIKSGYGFLNFSSLESIALPESVINIPYISFGGCDNLKTVYVGKYCKINDDIFDSDQASVIVPDDYIYMNDLPKNISVYKKSQRVCSKTSSKPKNDKEQGGCYVATCVYGSYDCPPVWTLRRFRDNILAQNIFGRLFIKLYYAVSPTAVKLFGKQEWFHRLFKPSLDKLVKRLQKNGVKNTPYKD